MVFGHWGGGEKKNMQRNHNYSPCTETHSPRKAKGRAGQNYHHKLIWSLFSGCYAFRQRWANSIREVFSLQRVILQFT